MNLLRLFLVATTLFLSFALISCGDDNKAGVTGACEIKLGDVTIICGENVTSEMCNNNNNLIVNSFKNMPDVEPPVGKFVANVGCPKKDILVSCKGKSTVIYGYKITSNNIIINGIVASTCRGTLKQYNQS